MTYTNYTFQCPRCHLVSGVASITPDDAPTCCDGVRMVAIRHDYETPRTVGEVLDDANPTIAALRERVRELEAEVSKGKVTILALQLVRDQLKNAEPIERAAAVRAERERWDGSKGAVLDQVGAV